MIVTIDGPAAAGKSSTARELARRLGFHFLDTGAMYRAVALAGLQRGIAWDDAAAVAELVATSDLAITADCVVLDGEDVSQAIRTLEVTNLTRHAADNRIVREHLVALQRSLGKDRDLVTEGRDQATVVFPTAECKIFLTASAEVRAQRRLADLRAQGESVALEEVLAEQRERDRRDLEREFGGLRLAEDAIEVDTDGLTSEQVLQRLEQIVRDRRPVAE